MKQSLPFHLSINDIIQLSNSISVWLQLFQQTFKNSAWQFSISQSAFSILTQFYLKLPFLVYHYSSAIFSVLTYLHIIQHIQTIQTPKDSENSWIFIPASIQILEIIQNFQNIPGFLGILAYLFLMDKTFMVQKIHSYSTLNCSALLL